MARESIDTVNVMEIADGKVLRLTAFPDNARGNDLAETLFGQIARENGAKPVDVSDYIENGYYSAERYPVSASYELFLIHSSF